MDDIRKDSAPENDEPEVEGHVMDVVLGNEDVAVGHERGIDPDVAVGNEDLAV